MNSRVIRSLLLATLFVSPQLSAETIKTYHQTESAPKYFEENGKIIGICVDYIQSLNGYLKDQDAFIEILRGASFARVKKDLESSKIGVFFGISKSTARAKIYDYGEALYSIQYVFVVPAADNTDYTQVSDFGGKRIGVLRGAASVGYLKENYKNFSLVETTTTERALKMLESGRVDAVYYHDLGLVHQMKKLDLMEKTKISPSTAKIKLQYYAYSKSLSKEARSRVSAAFKQLVEDGKQDEMLKQYGVYANFVKASSK